MAPRPCSAHRRRRAPNQPASRPSADLSLDLLTDIFTTFETERIPKTAELVKGAREAGEMRVVAGLEAAKRRNDAVRWNGLLYVPL
uniref:Uncharacterized protein n=1 Tax=Mycena chlorophos TaxID=658473 RepID=A0ABQ0LUN6_MYCCL|nr:predicted protein [Mycena chlorophos]